MLLSLTHNFVFIANLKTASTAIEKSLAPYAEIALTRSEDGKHLPFSQIEIEFGRFLSNRHNKRFFVFGVMREPVDFLLSLYNAHLHPQLRDTDLYTGNMTFDEFLDVWSAENSEQTEEQFRRFLNNDGQIGADYIISYQNLQDGINFVANSIGLSEILLNIENVSENKLTKADISDEILNDISQNFATDILFMSRYCDRLIPEGEATKFDLPAFLSDSAEVKSATSASKGGSANAAGMEARDAEQIDIKSALADANTVELLFQAILGRSIGNVRFKEDNNRTQSIFYWIMRLVNSEEFKIHFAKRNDVKLFHPDYISDIDYRIPSLRTSIDSSVVLLTGSCLTDGWKYVIEGAYPEIEIRHQLFNNGSDLEDIPEHELRQAKFQIVQIPIRSVIAEGEYFSTPLSEIGKSTFEKIFQNSLIRLRRNLDSALKYNKITGIPVFVLNFTSPQANPLGFLLPKYELSNFSHYIKELNLALYQMISEERSVYMIDHDEITSTLGKRFIQDDITSHINHGSFIGSTHNKFDIELTPPGSVEALYAPKRRDTILAIFNECVASFNIISSSDKIKIVIFDLDGTLWRGVPAEHDVIGADLTEGWPLGILEAASFLKKRGILLAIASKNDPEMARRIWSELYEKRFPLSNFVSTKFSWGSKIDSVAEILQETNLLPGNCLFVDDNPVEREQVQLAFPDIKVISGPIYTWRRTLLWASELQVPYVTEESINRTESIQGMILREGIKKELDEEDYIRDLQVKIRIEKINHLDHKKFPRSLELVNKTNQFNTTGRRWSEKDIARYFADGGCLLTADVSDRLSDYGLTAVLLCRDGECSQIVMSCRVFGLRVEFAVFSVFLATPASNRGILFRDTGKNPLCRKFLEKLDLAPPAEQVTSDAIILDMPYGYRLPDGLTNTVSVITETSLTPTAELDHRYEHVGFES